MRMFAASIVTALPAIAFVAPAHADQARIAVAANFTEAARKIGTSFTSATGHQAIFSFASTGQIYVQISQGAPFDVFLAADRKRPRLIIEKGFGVAGSSFTYALGGLALYSTDAKLVTGADVLSSGKFTKLAIANPATAPYGAAAVEVLKKLKLMEKLSPTIVRGNNIAQTYQFVATGNAQLGFVALSQIAGRAGGSRWIVPETFHTSIAQDAVLLKRGENNPAAKAFLTYLKGPETRRVLAAFGYRTQGR
ncbi:MAG: molybdate ABC transporter substrate-binding protein [Hyphomicrobiales bacterium]|nr:molybdate ABC transporter substrate-binding protein [Hyphomicrobiales bacterium]